MAEPYRVFEPSDHAGVEHSGHLAPLGVLGDMGYHRQQTLQEAGSSREHRHNKVKGAML